MIDEQLVSQLKFPVIIASHMRSGTHLTIDLIRRQFAGFGGWKLPCEPNDTVYLPVDSLRTSSRRTWSDSRIKKVLLRSEHMVGKLHWTSPDFMEVIENQPAVGKWLRNSAKIIYVLRNPLAVVQSLWNWEIAEKQADESTVPCSEWLRERFRSWAKHVDLWTSRADPLILKYENIVANPAGVISTLERSLGAGARQREPLLPPKLRGLWQSRLNRIFSVRPTSTEILTTGAPTRIIWDEAKLKIARDQCGEQLARLGYEI